MGRGDTHGVLPVAEGGCPEMRQQDPERHLGGGGEEGTPCTLALVMQMLISSENPMGKALRRIWRMNFCCSGK